MGIQFQNQYYEHEKETTATAMFRYFAETLPL
jgi:hypothetical protein